MTTPPPWTVGYVEYDQPTNVNGNILVGRHLCVVGIAFPVNGKQGDDWHMAVTYEADDTYKVWLYANRPQFAVIDQCEDVYCMELKQVVESMYDKAIKTYNQGFITV